MGNECCVSRAGSKCDVNSTVLSERERGRGEGGGKSRVGRRGVREVGPEPGSALVPDRHVRAIAMLLGCQASPQQSCRQSPWGCQLYAHLPFFSGDGHRVGKDAKINYCV